MVNQILNRLENEKIVVLSEEMLGEILKDFKILEETETFFNGKIRILKFAEMLLIQEKSNKLEIIFRRAASQREADKFIKNRLNTYESMWNGCGCKINYYE